MRIRALLPVAVLFAVPAFGQDASENMTSEEALAKTKELLNTKEKRDAFVKSNAAAKKADDAVHSTVNGSAADKDELYGIASSVLEDLVRETGGDPDKLAQKLAEAQANPEAFLEHMKPEQRAKVKAAAQKQEQAQKKE